MSRSSSRPMSGISSISMVAEVDGPPTYDEVENMERTPEYYKVGEVHD